MSTEQAGKPRLRLKLEMDIADLDIADLDIAIAKTNELNSLLEQTEKLLSDINGRNDSFVDEDTQKYMEQRAQAFEEIKQRKQASDEAKLVNLCHENCPNYCR